MTENDTMRRVMESVAGGGDTVYPRQTTQRWFQFFWMIIIPGLWIANFVYLEPSTLFAHVRSLLIGIVFLKGWSYIPDYFDMAEDVGLVVPEDRETRKERLERKLQEIEEEDQKEEESDEEGVGA